MHFVIMSQRSRAEKQLLDRTRASFFGESKLLKRSCFTAEMSSSVGFGGGLKDLNFLQKLMCKFRASSFPILVCDRTTSSFTASAQSPQIQRPWNLSRTRLMYASVHSSVNPQHSHFANSTSFELIFGRLNSWDVWVSMAAIIWDTADVLLESRRRNKW